MEKVGVGIVGCGNISGAYLKAMRDFPILDIRGVADLTRARAGQGRGVRGAGTGPRCAVRGSDHRDRRQPDDPAGACGRGHAGARCRQACLFRKAARRDLCRRASPGGGGVGEGVADRRRAGHFPGRRPPDGARGVGPGADGLPVGGTATFMCPGHERWHPDPDFYYKEGGGPVLDMAPYYVTALVNLLGPVAEVAGFAAMPRACRTITSEPRNGETIEVEVPTHVAGRCASRAARSSRSR